MKLLYIISILLLIAGLSLAEDLIFFADDHYKSLGRPEIAVSVSNPVLMPGDGILRINLANAGELEELISINESGPYEDILQEMIEEAKSSNARNINVDLEEVRAIKVTTGPQHIDALAAGCAEMVQFRITAERNASGWYSLPLTVDYERQVDVSIKSGEIFPLYEAERQNITCNVFVLGSDQPLHISGIESELYAGGSESVRIAVSNDGERALCNCSARLLAAPPFYVESPAVFLGDLGPGSLHVIEFEVGADANASLKDYQMGCEVDCQEKSIIVPLQISLSRARLLSSLPLTVSLWGGLITAGLAAFLIWKRKTRLFSRKRRRRQI